MHTIKRRKDSFINLYFIICAINLTIQINNFNKKRVLLSKNLNFFVVYLLNFLLYYYLWHLLRQLSTHYFLILSNMEKFVEKFRQWLTEKRMSANTIRAYMNAVYTYYNIYGPAINEDNLNKYQLYLEQHYRPKTVNLRINAGSAIEGQ